ncbi:MAG: BREX-4 system phosphatase PglZ [bacterium]|nr:BREX-4 system phosphatase PglZ [bacterium]
MDERLRKKVQSYRDCDDQRPLFVDASTQEERTDFLTEYSSLKRQDIFDLPHASDSFPGEADIYNFLGSLDCKEILVTGLGVFLKILGKEDFERITHALLSQSFNSKVIFLTYQCAALFNEKDPRNKDRICFLGSLKQKDPSSSVFLVPKKYSQDVIVESNLCDALKKLESTAGKNIYVATNLSDAIFRKSEIRIGHISSAYSLLVLRDNQIKNFSEAYGTDDQWGKLLSHFKGSFAETVAEYINIDDPLRNFNDFSKFDSFERWIFFLFLSYKYRFGNQKIRNWAIQWAIDNSQNAEVFYHKIFDAILEENAKAENYWKKYNEWKDAVSWVKDEAEVQRYCNKVETKGENSLYYLTDNTDYEKKEIILTIDKYREKYTKPFLLEILSHIYKDLFDYLSAFDVNGDSFLTDYFNEYRLLKVTNYLDPDFKEKVDEESTKRSFKRRLPTRAEVLDSIDFNDSVVYFIDALGAEYSGFIKKKAAQNGLSASIYFGRANLPSITEKNTEFRDFFARKGITVFDKKDLDELVHDGKEDFDFDKNKYPIHIIEAFNIITGCLAEIRKRLKNSPSLKKAVIVSDHGSTRLAVLNDDVVRFDVDSDGEHSGRVCKAFAGMEQLPNAIIEDGYCVLADYNSFKGGRRGKIEMHGGATLEEVTVPVIEIRIKENKVPIAVVTPIIKVSYKTSATLYFRSAVPLGNVFIVVNGKKYSASSPEGRDFTVVMEDIKKTGVYQFEVWSDDELVSDDPENTFTIQKESAQINNLFD